MVALAGSLGLRNAPLGLLITNTTPDCIEAGGVDGVNPASGSPVSLLLGVCKKIDLFTGFKGASPVECPASKTGVVTAYYSTDCTGTGIAVGVTVTTVDSEEIAADPAEARLRGQSAKFICINSVN